MTGSTMMSATTTMAPAAMLMMGGMGGMVAAMTPTLSATIDQENAYIQNPGFPAALMTTGNVNFMVSKKDQGDIFLNICEFK